MSIKAALSYMQSNDHFIALQLLQSALEKAADKATIYCLIGQCHFATSVEQNPSPSSDDFHAALLEKKVAPLNTEEALAAFQEALRLNPNLSEAHHHISLVYKHLNNIQKAYTHALSASRIDLQYLKEVQELFDNHAELPFIPLEGASGDMYAESAYLRGLASQRAQGSVSLAGKRFLCCYVGGDRDLRIRHFARSRLSP